MATRGPQIVFNDEDLRKLYLMSHWMAGSDGGELLREWIRDFARPERWPFEGRIEGRIADVIAANCRAEIDRGTDLALAHYARGFLDRLARGGWRS